MFNAEIPQTFTKSDLPPSLRALWGDDLVYIEFSQCNKPKGYRRAPHGITWEVLIKRRDENLFRIDCTFNYIKMSQSVRKQQIKQVLEQLKR